MPAVCFYFQVHQPYRIRHYTVFDQDTRYFDDHKNQFICRKVANKCYLPANRLILKLIEKHKGRFKVSYSLTGVLIEQLHKYAPEVFESFEKLAKTGCVEFLAETYYHSLAFLYSREEFKEQVNKHRDTVERLFGQRPRVFRNTELIYSNELPLAVSEIGGFDAVMAEGADHILGYRSPNFVYRPVTVPDMKLLLKNYRLSDDIAFRFSNRQWAQWPLVADKFAGWINQVNGCGTNVNLFMDYETFGEHQWEDTGIFDFLNHLPDHILAHPDNSFMMPSEVIDNFESVAELDFPHIVSWADIERDLSAWLGNPMQKNALDQLYALEGKVRQCGDAEVLEDWRRLQTSDHFYYMCTKYFSDGDVHKYFNPYDSPYDSYINFMNVLDNLEERADHIMAAREPEPAVQRRRLPVAKRKK
jgi:alpha-amylase